MRIRHEELSKRAAALEMPVEALGEHIARPGLSGERAVTAVRNWMAGRDHPRCKAGDIRRLAEALGCEAKDISSFESSVVFHRGSAQKARLVVELVRGKPVDEALNILSFSTKRAAVNVKKALEAAIADAESVGEADVTSLVVSKSEVDGATHIKRFRPKDRGRAHPILKGQSHIRVAVQEASN